MLRIINNQNSSFGMKFAGGGGVNLLLSAIYPPFSYIFLLNISDIFRKNAVIYLNIRKILFILLPPVFGKKDFCAFSPETLSARSATLQNYIYMPAKLCIYKNFAEYIYKCRGIYT
jgi:hypothetical protein